MVNVVNEKVKVTLVGGPISVVEWTYQTMRICVADETGVWHYYNYNPKDSDGNWKGIYNV